MKGSLFVFLGACSYGVLSTIVALAYNAGFSLNDVVGSQMVIGAAMLWVFVLFRFRRGIGPRPDRSKMMAALLAGSSTGSTGLLYYAALQYLSPAMAVVLFFQFTWMGLIADAILHRRKPRPSQIASLIPIVAGTVLATNLLGEGFAHLQWQGVVFGLLAAFSNTILIFVSGRVALQLDPIFRSTLMVSGGAILTSLIVPPTFLLTPETLVNLLLSYGMMLAFFGSVFSVWMFAMGAPLISTTLAAILSSMQLPMTMLLSIFVLQIPVSSLQLVGIGAILFGVVLSETCMSNKKKQNKETAHGYQNQT